MSEDSTKKKETRGRPKKGVIVPPKVKSENPAGRPATGFNKKEYNKKINGPTNRVALSVNNIAAKSRFFIALDWLIEKKVLTNLAEFCRIYGFNLSNMGRLRVTDSAIIPPNYLILLVEDFNVSADWLLTGRGEMMDPNFKYDH